ncbi:hypothetical protein HMPREF0281_01484 [Corynebacterium ammoniagenes DSM 20306]|uniref:Uncharacterized protein n=1 Tax=Corynebacterium ammoniagenes DSM 20306 TaxID=649754 RepID=A0ABP2ICP4_CORAM|nr:hypothetical protein HMPREF0281_01484 [Corynebacterium ammoniagenes DSM 20306]
MPLSETCSTVAEDELEDEPGAALAEVFATGSVSLGAAQAASAAPPPTVTTVRPPARSAVRRENWSAKYGLLEVLSHAPKHALPHL